MNIGELDKDVAICRQFILLIADVQQKTDMVRTSLIAGLSDGRVKTDEIYRVEKAKGKNPQNAAFLETYGARYARGPQTPPAPPA